MPCAPRRHGLNRDRLSAGGVRSTWCPPSSGCREPGPARSWAAHEPLTRPCAASWFADAGVRALGVARSRVFNKAVTLEVRLLGPLEVDVDGRILDVRRQKQRALLALLALRAGEVVPTDRLVDELWGDEPPKAAVGSLQNFVSELRKMLGAEVLVTRAPGYLLDIPRDAVDVHRFERIVREAGSEGPEQRAAGLREALGLWRGPALADVQLEDAMVAEAARLEESRVAAWEDRLEAEPALGRPSQGIEELGIDPSHELQRLEQAILRHDKELDLPEAPRKRVPALEPDRRKTVTILFADLV